MTDKAYMREKVIGDSNYWEVGMSKQWGVWKMQKGVEKCKSSIQ